ncbi:MAG TPA: hypothetical protein VF530_17120 [Planctomycetota bacterium]
MSEPVGGASAGRAREFVRGSSLLLGGRVIAVGVNFVTQVLAVRTLAKAEFGALAWALSITTLGASVVLLGLNRGVAQLAPFHHERRDHGALFGTMGLALGTVAGLGLAVVLLVLGLRDLWAGQASSELGVGLLLILVGLIPLEALDALLETWMAVLAEPRAVFLRRYLLAPGLKLAAVLSVVLLDGGVHLLAWAYLLAGMLGLGAYALLLRRALARQGIPCDPRRLQLSASPRALFGISLPLLTTDLLLAVETPVVVVFLERWHSTLEVAELRAVAPVAGLCLLVLQNSKILFRPQAARLVARGDRTGLGELYWRSAAWMALTTFPVFAVCTFLAGPLCTALFGPAYAQAGTLLAILAAGKYVNAALGMNTFTLQVHGRVRLVLLVNALSAVLGLAACLSLIPRHGAVGGALATTLAIVARNGLYQLGLLRTTSIGRPSPAALGVYGSVLVAVAGLALLRTLWPAPAGMLVAILATSALLAWLNRGYLDIAGTFPELARVPMVRWLLSGRAP